MKKDVLLEITGIQTVDGEADTTVLTTGGQLAQRNGCWYITYAESEATGMPGAHTTLKLERDGSVTLLRSGSVETRLSIVPNALHHCTYGTPYGPLLLEIRGHSVEHQLGEDGGWMQLRYAIEVDGVHASDHHLKIIIKESVN